MISGTQICESRALLEWSVSDLAECARIDVQTVLRAEIFMPFVTTAENSAIRCAFEAIGVEFILENGGGAVVRLRDAEA